MSVSRILPDRPATMDGWTVPHVPAVSHAAAAAETPSAAEAAALTISISPDASAATATDGHDSFEAAFESALGELGREADKALRRLGLTEGEARQASSALLDAVRAGPETFAFELDAAGIEDRELSPADSQGFSYRAALVVERATVAWSPAEARFVATVETVALSMNVESGTLLVNAAQSADARRDAVEIRIDAVVPVRERANGAGVAADPVPEEPPFELRLTA